MSTKFEQLLDYLVNENMEQANELFHEIVVEKSREIYENLIAEEEDEDQEESVETDDDAVDEDADKDDEDQQDESMEMEDSYGMEGEEGDDHGFAKGDAADEFGAEVSADGEEGPMDGEDAEDAAIFDFKDAFAKLEAAFAELEAAQGGEEASGEFGGEEDGEKAGAEFGSEEDGEDEMMGSQAFEGRRMTREYVEKVGNDWEKSGSQKSQGQYVGAKTGGTEGAPQEGRSPIASGKNKPGPAGVNASNILRGGVEGQSNTGDRPLAPVKGITPTSGDKFAKGIHNVDGVKSGVKTLGKVAAGHGAEKKGSGPGPVGAGTGDKAGQTGDASGTKKQFLPQYK